MHPVEAYLRELRDIRSSGSAVKETSYYGPLATLLNEVGRGLRPRVHCIINLKNQGAGIPDGGLFTPDQLHQDQAAQLLKGQTPARGALEVKGTGEDVRAVARSPQVRRYWERYRQVLVTNLRDWVLVGQDADGEMALLEGYALAPSEAAFWSAAADPRAMAEEHGERFAEYLKRVMLHAAPLAAPKDVAWMLASYARDARVRVERSDLPALAQVRSALEQALGLRFEGERGEHFFRSTLVQTLFYGVFSAWVLWSKGRPATSTARFSWREAEWSLHVPMIRALFEQLNTPSRLGPLKLVEVLDWTGTVLNRVDRAAFFDRFEEGEAVQYFYEPFLEAFDPELRKQLGVWYTPPEIVRYMVARVDAALREELGIADGLADPNVYVLDPCTGTGSYLVEVLRRICETLRERGDDALAAYDLKRAAMERVFGFELLPAPFVVAHLQLGLLLQNVGAPLSDERDERAGVYLTNALTGWAPPQGPKQHLLFPELEQERDAAEEVKREKPILVVIGNPPYNGYAGVSPAEEQGLVEPYKQGLKEWGITKNYLDDLYVRFFRLAERRIAEMTHRGVVCYISNFSYLSDPSFVVMRQRFLAQFDELWFDSLNGDSRKTGKLTPEGKPDPSVFSTQYNKEGIRVGTAIGLMVRKEQRAEQPRVHFRQFWGVTKRADLVNSLQDQSVADQYVLATPNRNNRFSFQSSNVSSDFYSWPSITKLGQVSPMLGLNDNRGQATHDISKNRIAARMTEYYDPSVSFETIATLHRGLTTNAASFNAKATRDRLVSEGAFSEDNIRRFWFKPFDLRWAYVERSANLWNRVRPELLDQAWLGNEFLLARAHAPKSPDGSSLMFSRHISDQHVMHTDAYFIPIRLRPVPIHRSRQTVEQAVLFEEAAEPAVTANLSQAAREYLALLGVADPDADAETAGLIWMHALAIGYAPAYLTENADGIRQDWPRIPLPESREALLASAELGRRVAALLDTERPAPGVTEGSIRPELRVVAALRHEDGGAINPDAGDLAVTADWGHGGNGKPVMPGSGKLARREYAPEERAAIETGAAALGLPAAEAVARLGEGTLDVYLNPAVYWRNVPERVWGYTIGGYQVMKKWLSYREADLLGRPLTAEEAREVTAMARRIAAILLLEPELDANYRRAAAAAYAWPGEG